MVSFALLINGREHDHTRTVDTRLFSPSFHPLHQKRKTGRHSAHLVGRALSQLAAAPGQRGKHRVHQVVCVRLPAPLVVLVAACTAATTSLSFL